MNITCVQTLPQFGLICTQSYKGTGQFPALLIRNKLYRKAVSIKQYMSDFISITFHGERSEGKRKEVTNFRLIVVDDRFIQNDTNRSGSEISKQFSNDLYTFIRLLDKSLGDLELFIRKFPMKNLLGELIGYLPNIQNNKNSCMPLKSVQQVISSLVCIKLISLRSVSEAHPLKAHGKKTKGREHLFLYEIENRLLTSYEYSESLYFH